MSTSFFGTPLRPQALVALAALGVPTTHALALDYAPLFDADVRRNAVQEQGVSIWESDLDGRDLTIIAEDGTMLRLLAAEGANNDNPKPFVRVVMRPEDAPLHLPRALVLDQIERIEAPAIDARVYGMLCALEAAVRAVRFQRLPKTDAVPTSRAADHLVEVRTPAHA